MRERIEAMKEIWARSKPKYSGELVKFDEMMQWPKPVQKPHPPIIVGGGFPQGARRAVAYADGWMPIGGRGGDTLAMLPPFREMLKEKGRDPAEVPITLLGVGMNGEALKQASDAGVDPRRVRRAARGQGQGPAPARQGRRAHARDVMSSDRVQRFRLGL